MDEYPTPLIVNCPCGRQAKHAVAAVLQVGDKQCTAAVPVCDACLPRTQLLRVEAQNVPTHEPFNVRKATAFPPARGEVFIPAMVVGCPACGAMGGLDRTVFSLTEEGIKPSYICKACAFHGWLRWAP